MIIITIHSLIVTPFKSPKINYFGDGPYFLEFSNISYCHYYNYSFSCEEISYMSSLFLLFYTIILFNISVPLSI